MFTTRDGNEGLEKFKKYYLSKDDMDIRMVGDPAFWIKECYGIEKKDGSDVIGINLIRGKIFEAYGKNISEEALIDIYCDLLKRLDENNIKWELFTNGLSPDLKFGKQVLERYGKKDILIHVPKTDIELVKMISGYKAIVGARLHALICAYALDVPMVGYIWDEKLLRFAQIASLNNVFVNEEELSGDKLYATLNEAMDFEYDSKLRDIWKNKTKDSIYDFLHMN